VICEEEAVHVCYCHNPFRYAWNERHRTLAERSEPFSRAALRWLFRRWREWDWIAAQRVDRYVTNSRTTQARIRSSFGRDSRIVYPPVATERFRPASVEDHYLVLSELVSHKQIEVAVEAFNRLRLRVVIAGDGPARRHLERLAGPTIRFTGSDPEASRLLSSCRALVVTAPEEFGIAAVEAQAAGRPVIARRAGGLLENVVDGQTGCWWEGGPADLAEAVATFDWKSIDPQACVENARRFDSAVFRDAFPREVDEALLDGPAERLESWPRVRRRAGNGRRPVWGPRRFA
jgi:glycosyltransferase involved in cell wall biosynthesis